MGRVPREFEQAESGRSVPPAQPPVGRHLGRRRGAGRPAERVRLLAAALLLYCPFAAVPTC
ncbi:hypothetical protein OG203_15155 [Nocardia sp. NBC_01499]|uniref:hypothetical protein n=1 Tax=Nocardia sp. NBC_01499 TaxID=2903597 RepID=UPI0038669701